jgi:hypothetical protein
MLATILDSSHRSNSGPETRTFRPNFLYAIWRKRMRLRQTAWDSLVISAGWGTL